MIRLAAGTALLAVAGLVAPNLADAAERLRRDVGPNASPVYEKECGGCHFPYQPGWLPERSWRHLMATLARHFGESAEVSAASATTISAYLAAGAADHARNVRSREVMQAIKPGETPTSITRVLYVGGIHGGFLDPAFRGEPAVKTLAQCPACHQQAERGWFAPVSYTISDESFRSNEADLTASFPFLRKRK